MLGLTAGTDDGDALPLQGASDENFNRRLTILHFFGDLVSLLRFYLFLWHCYLHGFLFESKAKINSLYSKDAKEQ